LGLMYYLSAQLSKWMVLFVCPLWNGISWQVQLRTLLAVNLYLYIYYGNVTAQPRLYVNVHRLCTSAVFCEGYRYWPFLFGHLLPPPHMRTDTCIFLSYSHHHT
jgi:hypothetical protein